MEGPQPELSGHGSSRRRAMGQLGSREDRSMTRYERQKLRQRLTFHGSQFERGDGSSLDALLRALDLIDQVEGERDIYRRALERMPRQAAENLSASFPAFTPSPLMR